MIVKKFEMDAVLNYRRLTEDGIQREIAEMKEKIKTEELRISYLEAIHDESIVELKRRQEEQVSSLEIDIYYSFIAQTTKEIQKWKRVLSQMKSQYEKKMAELLSAFKDRRIMETIKEKMDNAYMNKVKKEGQMVIDELSTAKYNHGRSSLK